jgi:DNA replication protein DnaD
MDERGQFTFYRSFWEAVKSLPKKDRLPVLEAIISYALDGTFPEGLSQSQSAFFLLVKPNLDASRKKAANGKQGGSKPKANGKQNASKKEREKEKEGEIEIENEIENEIEKEYECNNYRGGSNAGVDEHIEKIAADLFNRYVGRASTKADCDMIYNRVVFGNISDPYAAGLLEYAFEAAHKAGKAGNWNYIEAVLDRCSLENIYTADEARRADEERGDHAKLSVSL